MASTYKVLGQSNPASNTVTTLYTVPADTQTVCSTLTVCNTGASTTYRVIVLPDGDTLATKNYIIYEAAINAYETLFFTLGISLKVNDKVQVYATNSTGLSFSLFGSEAT